MTVIKEEDVIRIADSAEGKTIALFPMGRRVAEVSRIGVRGVIVGVSELGEVAILCLFGGFRGIPWATPRIMWRWGDSGSAGLWEDVPLVICPWCGRRIKVAARVAQFIEEVSVKAGLSPDEPPSLSLPAGAWKLRRLQFSCPGCDKPLRLTPFTIDNRDLYPS